jgi:hypothetical protein
MHTYLPRKQFVADHGTLWTVLALVVVRAAVIIGAMLTLLSLRGDGAL